MRPIANIAAVTTSIARAAAIWCIAGLCVIVYGAVAIRRLAIRDHHARAEHRARWRGALLRWSFSQLGASFIKIGQVMSARADLLAPGVIAELRELQDHVRPFAFRRVRAIIERELGAPMAATFRELDAHPLAAGSIAQVHRGVLHSGEEVAVKVLRPGVHARVRRDARLMLWLAHLAHVVSARARAADVIGHVRSLVQGIVVQTDLRHEAANYDLFRTQFAGVDGLAFPAVHERHSTGAVLTMEMIHGVHIEAVEPRHIPRVTRVLRAAFFAMCFDHGLVHADLHPGNILVRADGSVVVLDVGLVKFLDADAIARLLELTSCLVLGSADDLVDHLRAHHRYDATTNWDAVADDAETLVTMLKRATICELEVSVVVGQLFALARKHHIRPLPELSLVLLGMVTIEGIAKRLDPTANTMVEVARYLAPRMTHRRLARGSGRWLPVPPVARRLRPQAAASPASDRAASPVRGARGARPASRLTARRSSP